MTSEHSMDILNNVFAKNCTLTTTKNNTQKNKKNTIKAIKQIKKVSFLDEKKYFIINDDGVLCNCGKL